MDNAPKKREWVKTVAIIFLAILLALTFFSNTIQNMTLPEVSTVAVDDGSITAKIRATGKVNAVGNNEVKAEGTRTIAAVKVKVGQEVSEGDILFVMGEAGTEELEVATDARDSASWSYKRAQNSYPIDTTKTSRMSADTAATALEHAEVALAEARKQVDAYTLTDESIETAQNEVYQAQENLAMAIESAQATRDQAERNFQPYVQKLEELYNIIDERQRAWEEAQTEEEKQACEIAYYQAVSDCDSYYQTEYVPAETTYLKAMEDTSGEEAAKTNLYNAEAKLNSLTSSYNIANEKYQQAVQREEEAQAAFDLAMERYYLACDEYNQSAGNAWLNVQEAKETLDKKQAKVDNLEGIGEDINVYAKVSGIVESVSFSSGDKVVKDDVMCVIEVPDMGYKMDVSVTKDQANRLKVGDVGEAVNYYWGKSVTGTINTIKADPKSPQDKRIITFELEGDVTNGQELTLSVGQKSATYDFIVPKSAVKSDNNGYFVLKIESKSNALGNRYFAKRVNIEILAEDDSNRAISGDIGYGDFIITNSSTKVNSGDQVRLADAS